MLRRAVSLARLGGMDAFVLPAKAPQTGTIVWLHGLGDSKAGRRCDAMRRGLAAERVGSASAFPSAGGLPRILPRRAHSHRPELENRHPRCPHAADHDQRCAAMAAHRRRAGSCHAVSSHVARARVQAAQ